jgi:multidrug efflux pump subunit AcrB
MALTLAVRLVTDNAIVMADPQQRAAGVILQGPDVAMVGSAIGGIANSGINTGRLFISVKPSNEHVATRGQIIQRPRSRLAHFPLITTYLQPLETTQIADVESNRAPVHAAERRHGRLPRSGL